MSTLTSLLTGQVKKVHIVTEDQARMFYSLIGSDVVLAPGSKVTGVLVLPEIIYLYPTSSPTLAQLLGSKLVRKIVACPVAALRKYGWIKVENVVVAGTLVREQNKCSLGNYNKSLMNCGREYLDDEEGRLCTVLQIMYQYLT